VPGIRQVLLKVFAEFEAGVIGRDVDAHGFSLEVATDAAGVGTVAREFIPSSDDVPTGQAQAGGMSLPVVPSIAVPKVVRTVAPYAFLAAVAVVTGALTPVGMHLLPHSIRSMANSSGPWTLITFTAVYLSGLRGLRAAAMGAVTFLGMDAAFYLVFDGIGGYYPHQYLVFWSVIAVLVGPIVGLSASWLRAPRGVLRALAVAAPSAVLVGEGVYMLVSIPGESTVYAVASVVVGVLLFAGLAAIRLRRLAAVWVSLAMAVGGGAAFFVIYGLTPLVLNKVVP
jgi:hypothetical protein